MLFATSVRLNDVALQWLTPDTLPATTVTVSITCPDDIDLIACVIGALSLLEDQYNWQQYGTITIEQVTDEMRNRIIGITVT